MRNDNKTISGLTKRKATVEAYATITIEYLDTNPNYFRVQNQGATAIYCGTSGFPTVANYDFMVKAGSMKMYSEPFKRNKIYIYNPSGTAITVSVVSLEGEFDPVTFALSDMEIDLSAASLEVNSIISGFSSALPTGNNKIGSVGLATEEKGNLESLAVRGEVIQAVETPAFHSWEGTAVAGGISKSTSGEVITMISYLSNDGAADLTVRISGLTADLHGAYQETMTLKPGETLENLKVFASGLTLTGTSAFRCGYNSISRGVF